MDGMLERYREELSEALDRFGGLPLLVAGDVILDEFVWGRVDRISPEAPVPVVEVSRESVHLGGAANVAANLAALGARVTLLGVVGADAARERLAAELGRHGIEPAGLVTEPDRRTSVKTRIIAHHQQVCRTDRETRRAPTPETASRLLERYRDSLAGSRGVLLSDYGKGVLAPPLAGELASEARAAGKFVAVDPKAKEFSVYRGASAISPNQREAEAASGVAITDEASLRAAGVRLRQQCGASTVLITRGEQGMALLEGESLHLISTMAREVFDVTGAGDTVIAVFTLGVTAGLSTPAAALLANLAAGIVVGKLGTAVVTREELRKAVRQ